MDVHKKKKPRQRNRPKNKANRLQDIENKSSEKVEQNIECVPPQLQFIEKKSCQCLVQEKPASATSPPVSTTELTQNEASIKLIQQLLRAKCLKQNAAKKTDLTHATDITPNSKSLTSDHQESSIKKSKSKEKLTENKVDKDAFIVSLKKKMESVMTNDNSTELPQTLLSNLQELFSQKPISDVESSDDEEQYIEYIYKPRQYFLVSLCNFCKCDLRSKELLQCSRCKMTYYCSAKHMKRDDNHRQLCYALRQVADSSGTHLFYKCGDFSTEQFRSYRIVTIRKVEAAINRPLTASEQEVILFPRICASIKCREYRFDKLADCADCGQDLQPTCKETSEALNFGTCCK